MSGYGHRRGATHAKTPRRRGSDRVNSFADSSPSGGPAGADGRRAAGDPWIGRPDPPRPGTDPPAHQDDYPSWPGRPGPYALHPDHPSWPGGPDPRWAATEAALRADDCPSWPTGKIPATRGAGPAGGRSSKRGSNGSGFAGDGDPIFHQRFYQYSACSLFLLTLRLPPVKRWITARQQEGRNWLVWVTVVPIFAVFVLGFIFIINEEIFKGIDSFMEHPSAE